jgi:GntR family transcriptional regulator
MDQNITNSLSGAMVDKDTPVPLYYQLKRHLSELIDTCADGDLIPTESELCAHFDVSRPTVRQAINELVNEGKLRRQKGKGTFVIKQKLQRDFMLTFETFDQEILAHGRTPLTRLISIHKQQAGDRVAHNLKIPRRSSVYVLRRLRYTNNVPLMTVTSYLPADLVPAFEENPAASKTLHKRLESQYGYRLTRATRAIEAVAAEAEEAELLDIPTGSPLQYLETWVYIENDRCIEFSNAWYRGDQNKFTIELHRSHLETR